jgi:UDP-N-acetylmuramoyl-L-alanyl-D-glutamate--2,6-diaminopimelate ligase
MSFAAKAFYGSACDGMKIIGIVGTNGKTTVAHMLLHVLSVAGHKAAAIGTLGVNIKLPEGKFTSLGCSGLTTPDPIDLHRSFRQLHALGVTHVALEVSAHAIHFHKIDGIRFAAVIFTNISRDHLDFFPTFENYCDTKINFFLSSNQVQSAVVNIDQTCGKRIFANRTGDSLSYSLQSAADFVASKIKLRASHSTFDLCSKLYSVNTNIKLAMPAMFNVVNAVAFAAAVSTLGIRQDVIAIACKTMPPIPGRFNVYKYRGVHIVIDYAHTPDGLAKLIEAAREVLLRGKRKIITVFGCGGDRDREKRPIMGKVAMENSDITIITSDNPRREKPSDIIAEILGDTVPDNQKVFTREDRKVATGLALVLARRGDVILLAGKGAEEFIDIGGKKFPYSDEEAILSMGAKRR